MRYIDNPEISKKYNSIKWRKTRKIKLLSVNGLCERCLKKELYSPAIIVHHREYINESNFMIDEVFYNLDNLEALCLKCHNEEHFKKPEEFYFDEDGNVLKK